MKYNINLSKRIDMIREELYLSKEKMAKELNITIHVYYNLINGKRKLDIQELEILVLKFSVNSYWLFTGDGEMFIEKNQNLTINELNFIYRRYGSSHLIVAEIVKKLFNKNFLTINEFGDHIPYSFTRLIVYSDFSGPEKEAKNYLRNKIDSFEAPSPTPSRLKGTLHSMLEKIDDKDCFFLLMNKKIAAEQILTNISSFNIYCNNVFIKKDRELHNDIRNIN